ncbi:MAG: hypothetical protein KDI37_18515, partial [Xanthomonadales bacterium]|nr:hypothetical protein [Xanthomonadales bacterium]
MADESAVATLAALRPLGWHEPELPPPPRLGDQLARVVAPHRASLDVCSAAGPCSAKPVPALR